MRKYKACNWCVSVVDLKLQRIAEEGRFWCADCLTDLSLRCSACVEEHREECNGEENKEEAHTVEDCVRKSEAQG